MIGLMHVIRSIVSKIDSIKLCMVEGLYKLLKTSLVYYYTILAIIMPVTIAVNFIWFIH